MNVTVKSQHPPLRVAINAPIEHLSGYGGIETYVLTIVKALGQLTDDSTEYVVVGPPWNAEWLRPYLGRNQRLAIAPVPSHLKSNVPSPLKRTLGPLRPLARKCWRKAFPLPVPSLWPQMPVSDGFYEALGCEVIHFPTQEFVVCALPTVFNPIDLQHRHYPQFFTPRQIAKRETILRAGCQFAHKVVTNSNWIRTDVITQYGVPSEKTLAIPIAPPTLSFPTPTDADRVRVREKYALPATFAYYPAMTWAHKNHERLLEALARLRDSHGLVINLICTGKLTDHWPHLQQAIQRLRLEPQVRFLGLVPHEDLRPIYGLAQFVVIPTLFEAASGPLFETWVEGTPACCSSVTSLPEQAGDAALIFDPFSVESIADAAAKLATSPELRETLRQNGVRRLKDFSLERTAKAYRALYRQLAHRQLTDEDRWLLSWDWMREPNKKQEIK